MAWLTCFSCEGNLSGTCYHVEAASTVNIQGTLFACSLCLLCNHMSWVTPSLLPMCLAPAAVKGTHHIHNHCGSDGSVPTSSHFHKQMSQTRGIPSSPRGCSINAHYFCIPSPFLCQQPNVTSSYLAVTWPIERQMKDVNVMQWPWPCCFTGNGRGEWPGDCADDRYRGTRYGQLCSEPGGVSEGPDLYSDSGTHSSVQKPAHYRKSSDAGLFIVLFFNFDCKEKF